MPNLFKVWEACFSHRIKIKKGNCDLFHNSDLFFPSQFRGYLTVLKKKVIDCDDAFFFF